MLPCFLKNHKNHSNVKAQKVCSLEHNVKMIKMSPSSGVTMFLDERKPESENAAVDINDNDRHTDFEQHENEATDEEGLNKVDKRVGADLEMPENTK